jgi:hypothetical protein
MKKGIFVSIMLVVLIVMISSCYSIRKNRTGCPANPQAVQKADNAVNA